MFKKFKDIHKIPLASNLNKFYTVPPVEALPKTKGQFRLYSPY